MANAHRLLLILFTIFFFITFAPKTAGEEESQAESSSPIQRVDNTDFPLLYLTNPQMQGDAIWLVQARLRELGYDIEPDGIFNQTTRDLVKIFQLANSLQEDGRVTREVWEKLMDEESDEACFTQPVGQPRIRMEIDLVKHTLTVFSDNQPIKQFKVGVGKSSTPSPLGEWKIVQKSLNWGNGFGTRWMRLNVPWGIYGIHGTDKPYSVGSNQSHGCIRMQNRDVEALYPLIPMGTTVKIMENGQIFPKSFSAPTLKEKAYGQNVVYLQSRLKENGILFDNADGRYGKMTVLAVKYYQIWHGLTPTGMADKELYRSLGMIQ